MWTRIRTVMMSLLLVALPVQSWAVATMVNCGPVHQRMEAPTSSAHMQVGQAHASHGHDSEVSAGHDHAWHHHDPGSHDGGLHEPADHEHGEPDHPPSSTMGKFKCSACATCCVGVALPSAILTFDASVSSDTIELGMPQGHVVFLTAGPERPPRTLLA